MIIFIHVNYLRPVHHNNIRAIDSDKKIIRFEIVRRKGMDKKQVKNAAMSFSIPHYPFTSLRAFTLT